MNINHDDISPGSNNCWYPFSFKYDRVILAKLLDPPLTLAFDSLAFVYCYSRCLLMLILFCLFWTYIWNIQWRWSIYLHILHDLLSCDNSPICKKLHTVTLLMMIRNARWTISSLYSINIFFILKSNILV